MALRAATGRYYTRNRLPFLPFERIHAKIAPSVRDDSIAILHGIKKLYGTIRMTNEPAQISERELDILRLVATGATNQQIARQLNISVNTVKVHLRNIFSKIGAVSRTEATMYAVRNGLIAIEPSDESADKSPDVGIEILSDASSVQPSDKLPSSRLEMAESCESPSPPIAVQRRYVPGLWLFIGVGITIFVLISILVLLSLRSNSDTPGTVPTLNSVQAPADTYPRWIMRASMPLPRDDFALAAYDLEREIYVIGGVSEDQILGSVERYDPSNDLWVSLGDKPTAVSNAGAIALRGKIYVPGGETGDGIVTNLVEVYDPRDQRWVSAAPLPEPRSQYALLAWEGRLFVLGGWDGQRATADVLIYDPEQDSWFQGVDLPAPRRNASAAVISGRIYIVGGEDSTGPLRIVERFDPTNPENRRWEGVAPLPAPIAQPTSVSAINTLLVFDAQRRGGLEYDQVSDAWKSFLIPDGVVVSKQGVMLDTSILFIEGASGVQPGGMSEYRAIFTTFVPVGG